MGSTLDDIGSDVTTDAWGNVYTTGRFQDTCDFDPGVGVFNLISNGDFDIYFAKYDSLGNFLWAKGMGGALADGDIQNIGIRYGRGPRITTDAAGNVYIAGIFKSDTVDFDPGIGVANVANGDINGGDDIFFAKYDSSGNYIWAHGIGSSGGDAAHDIQIGPFGNVYLIGTYSGTVDFDPVGVANLAAIPGCCNDIFFAKYDSNGNFIWVKGIGGGSFNHGLGITTDGAGNVYVTGFYQTATMDMDPGPDTAIIPYDGGGDTFFAKYDSSGNYIWAKHLGGPGTAASAAIKTDALANIYIVGRFRNDTVDFDPDSIGVANLIPAGNFDIFFAKYDPDGNYIWANKIGSTVGDEAWGADVDAFGNIYITGDFTNNQDFDPGPGVVTLIGGWKNGFLAKYDSSGNYVWAGALNPSSGSSESNGIKVDGFGHVYIAGQYHNTTDFDTKGGVANMTSVGQYDIYVAKYFICPADSNLVDTAICSVDSIFLENSWQTSSGTYYDTTLVKGCPVKIITTLTVNPVPGVSISGAGVSCNGDSSGSAIVTPGGGTPPYTYQWDDPGAQTGSTATSLPAGTYTVTVTDSNGCFATDSVIIDQPGSMILTVSSADADCDSNNGQAAVNVTGGTTPYFYLWNDTLAQTADTAFNLYADTYTVIVTDSNNCTDSATVTVSGAGNPVITLDSVINVSCNSGNDGEIGITITGGKIPYAYLWSNSDTIEDINNLTPETYIITVIDSAGCNTTDSITITEPSDLILSISATNVSCSGDADGSAIVSVNGGTPAYTYLWNSIDGNDSAVANLVEGIYIVNVTDKNNCNKIDTVIINVIGGNDCVEWYIYSGITPDGDGKDDVWIIKGLERFKSVSVIFFNRWGDIVYESDQYKNNWAGTNQKGKQLPDGVYYYVVKRDGEIFKGWVSVIR